MTRGGLGVALGRRIDALLVLGLGLGMAAFAAGESYVSLMNPAFRWVTLTGAALITGMGLALLWAPARSPRRPGAILVFAALIPLVVLARPFSMGVGAVRPPAGSHPGAPCGEAYATLEIDALFQTLSREADDVPEGTYAVPGRAYRSPALDAQGIFLLLDPQMACCLADVIAFGMRVTVPPNEPPPEPETWIYVCGTLRRLDEPVTTDPIRSGAIMFTAVSRNFGLDAERFVSFQSLLEDAGEKIPRERCASFRRALERTGLLEELTQAGPYTIFAPLDAAFGSVLDAAPTASLDPSDVTSLRRYLEGFVVRGSYAREALYERARLEALSGRVLSVEVVNGKVRVEGARILFGDQMARNGVVHIVHPPWPPEAR